MEEIVLPDDINVCTVTASSFPDGIMAAHKNLHSKVPFLTTRRFFGLSRPERGEIVYKAAAEELEPGEAEKLALASIVIKKGTYVSITIKDFIKDIACMETTFKELLSQPGIDPDGYCIEWYLTDKDVRCMVRLEN